MPGTSGTSEAAAVLGILDVPRKEETRRKNMRDVSFAAALFRVASVYIMMMILIICEKQVGCDRIRQREVGLP